MAFDTQRYYRYRQYVPNVKVLYKKKKARVYTGLVLSILTIAFFSFFAIRPTLVTIGGLIKEIRDKRELVTKMDQKITCLTQAQANYSQIEADLPLVEESLPQNPALSTLIKQIEALARLSSVKLEQVKYEETNLQGETEKKESQLVIFSFVASGDYLNLKNFLNSLDTLRRIVLVEEFAFELETKQETRLLTLTVDAQASYLMKQP